MRRTPCLAVPLVLGLGCMRAEMAYVKVSDPHKVAVLETETSPWPSPMVAAASATVIIPPGSVSEHRTPTWPSETVVERKADGSVLWHPDYTGGTTTLVGSDGALTRVDAGLLPLHVSDEFSIGPIYRRTGPRYSFATPWSNVEHVTIRHETVRVAAVLELAIGVGAMFLGAVALASIHDEKSPGMRGAYTATGVGLGAFGLVLDVCAIGALLTPDQQWAWTPPSS